VLAAQEALTLNYLWPVVLVLLSIPILKQKINFIGIFALLISFFGSLFIATRGNVFSLSFSNSYGVFLAILSTFIWSAFWLLNLFDKRHESTKLFYNFSFGMIYLIIYGIINQKIKIPEFYGLAGAAYIGIFEMGLTFFLWLKALSLSSNTAKVSNLIFLSPFISLIIISLILKETITHSTVIGLILIISGILIQRFYGSQKINLH
jgi:drug/metabolite transporter (DMT)-like permease